MAQRSRSVATKTRNGRGNKAPGGHRCRTRSYVRRRSTTVAPTTIGATFRTARVASTGRTKMAGCIGRQYEIADARFLFGRTRQSSELYERSLHEQRPGHPVQHADPRREESLGAAPGTGRRFASRDQQILQTLDLHEPNDDRRHPGAPRFFLSVPFYRPKAAAATVSTNNE